VTAGQNYIVHTIAVLQEEENDALQSTGGGAGPVGGGSGGLLSNPLTWLIGIVGSGWAFVKGVLPRLG